MYTLIFLIPVQFVPIWYVPVLEITTPAISAPPPKTRPFSFPPTNPTVVDV